LKTLQLVARFPPLLLCHLQNNHTNAHASRGKVACTAHTRSNTEKPPRKTLSGNWKTPRKSNACQRLKRCSLHHPSLPSCRDVLSHGRGLDRAPIERSLHIFDSGWLPCGALREVPRDDITDGVPPVCAAQSVVQRHPPLQGHLLPLACGSRRRRCRGTAGARAAWRRRRMGAQAASVRAQP
jgi:hypothetical protein